MKFSKMHALGNDFIVVDLITQKLFFNNVIIQRLANRNLGIGFDQLLLIEPPYDHDIDFHYRIYNADASEVSQCGNGIRCFASFVVRNKLTIKRKFKVSTAKTIMEVHYINDKNIKVNMGTPIWEPKKIPFIANKEENLYLINTLDKTYLCGIVSVGNPHCVIIVQDDIANIKVDKIGKSLTSHERFPEKINVPFIQIINNTEVKVRVFERGCGETNSCGSGACAAVAVAIKQNLLSKQKPITVHMNGGSLQVSWEGGDNPLYMIGEATHVFDGHIDHYNLK